MNYLLDESIKPLREQYCDKCDLIVIMFTEKAQMSLPGKDGPVLKQRLRRDVEDGHIKRSHGQLVYKSPQGSVQQPSKSQTPQALSNDDDLHVLCRCQRSIAASAVQTHGAQSRVARLTLLLILFPRQRARFGSPQSPLT